jgi:hypothetical protein
MCHKVFMSMRCTGCPEPAGKREFEVICGNPSHIGMELPVVPQEEQSQFMCKACTEKQKKMDEKELEVYHGHLNNGKKKRV